MLNLNNFSLMNHRTCVNVISTHIYEGVNGVPLKSVISKILAKKSVISKIYGQKSVISKILPF